MFGMHNPRVVQTGQVTLPPTTELSTGGSQVVSICLKVSMLPVVASSWANGISIWLGVL